MTKTTAKFSAFQWSLTRARKTQQSVTMSSAISKPIIKWMNRQRWQRWIYVRSKTWKRLPLTSFRLLFLKIWLANFFNLLRGRGNKTSTNTAWHLHSFCALFVPYEAELGNNGSYSRVFTVFHLLIGVGFAHFLFMFTVLFFFFFFFSKDCTDSKFEILLTNVHAYCFVYKFQQFWLSLSNFVSKRILYFTNQIDDACCL